MRRTVIHAVMLGALSLLTASGASAEEAVRIWVKAFIPNSHPTNPTYVLPVPGQSGKFMIPDPLPKVRTKTCFLTDNRGFSNDPKASARLTSDFVMVVGASKATIRPAGTAMHYAGPTHLVACETGRELEASRTASTDGCSIGRPAVADGKAQVVMSCKGTNPFAPAGAPAIDYGGTFTFDMKSKALGFEGPIGSFPAFEAYAALDRGPARTMFQVPPSGDSVWSLIDAGLGLNTRQIKVKPVSLQ